MKQFLNILGFEFSGYMKNKIFMGMTIAMVVLMGVFFSFPRMMELFDSKDGNDPAQPTDEKQSIVLVDHGYAQPEKTLEAFEKAMPSKDFILSQQSIEELQMLMEQGEYESAVIVTAPNEYIHIVQNINMMDSAQRTIDNIILELYQTNQLAQIGVLPQQASQILDASVQGSTINIGKDQTQSYLVTYLLVFALYIVIIVYGQLIATSVATEKSSRAMELLITSASPNCLIFGKVLGTGLASMFQFGSTIVASIVFFSLNKTYWVGNYNLSEIFNITPSIIAYAVLFFLLGFFIYAFLFGAIGSLASKVEDINTSMMPVTLLFIAAFMLVVVSMSNGSVDSAIMVIASYVPFTSPMAMFARISMGEVAMIEIAISVIILIASTIGIGYLSAKIYRVGVLLYGKPPKLLEIFKLLK